MTLHFTLLRDVAAGDMAPIPDAVIPALGTQLQLPRPLALIGAGVLVDTLTATSRADIVIPSCSQLGPMSIQPPFAVGGAPLTMDMTMMPAQLQVGEPISVQQVDSATYLAGLFFSDGIEPPTSSPIVWVRYTPGLTAAPNAAAWQDVSLELASRLPAGSYRVLAIRHVQAEVQAVRLVLANSPLRPGGFAMPVPMTSGVEQPSLPGPATTGVMGRFDAVAPPSLQVFRPTGTGAGAAGTGFLLLQRVGRDGCGCGGACGGTHCGGR